MSENFQNYNLSYNVI